MQVMNVSHETGIEKAFGFTPDDLKQNQHGELSAAQIARLRREATRIAVVVVVILGVIGVMSIISSAPDSSEVPLMLFCLIVPALVTLAATIGLTETAISPRVVSKRSGQVHLAYGFTGYDPPVGVEQERKARRMMLGRRGAFTMIVDDQEFNLTEDQYKTLRPGLDVEVFFVPTVHKIVSIDITDGPQSRPAPLPLQAPISISTSGYDDGSEDTLKA